MRPPCMSGRQQDTAMRDCSRRRVFRTLRTDTRLLLLRLRRGRPARRDILFIFLFFAFILLFTVVIYVARPPHGYLHRWRDRGTDRESSHFTKNVHMFLPRQPALDIGAFTPCSWLYLEFGAKDGRHLSNFFINGNGFLEDYLRATQSASHGFCAYAFHGHPAMEPYLRKVRADRGRKTHRFHVYSGVVPGRLNVSERVRLVAKDDPRVVEEIKVQSIDVRHTLRKLTFEWQESGREVKHMVTPRENGNRGSVVVRFNVEHVREAFWELGLLEAHRGDGLMCKRVDRVVLNLEKIPLMSTGSEGDIDDSDVKRAWGSLVTPPVDARFDPKNGLGGLIKVANEINERKGCRTTVHVIDEAGGMLTPKLLTDREVLYAILAGQPTFDERVAAQTESWMTAVPQDRLTIFTNAKRNEEEMRAAKGRNTVVTQPHDPSLELRLPLMQSWSHLVRVRESWDRTMKHNKDIKWLALVDDDTFVFPGGMREYLSKFDARVPFWGGSGEQARIDNGDSGQFAEWLRGLNKKHGGKHCYFPTEDMPLKLRGSHVEYGVSQVLNGRRIAHKVSHMCGDTFCKLGCPAVPQGAAIVLSRTLVEALRPKIETCERETSQLCRNCGSQRLYMCVNRYTKGARTLLTRGICRAPWKLEHREKFPFVLTFHGFNRHRGMALSTGSLHGDMTELWQLGKQYEEGVKQGVKSSYVVPMQEIAKTRAWRGLHMESRGRGAGTGAEVCT
ncbi:unnamed protein product [Chondrus crispus]|uniref:N-acetylgalactosaminide beta-1,3-galactosyltransferase n=1 Tax=Chondrus crispus TaxID=2769 RepID=R7QNR5_CHOCR|nr:unnamed protein product [Chondrus crispus]CDF39749.1 unnamed protein product [Chondrus crispus]|eukprot:XP_005710043.1 unnamed protein product [Chondrus crispus]